MRVASVTTDSIIHSTFDVEFSHHIQESVIIHEMKSVILGDTYHVIPLTELNPIII